LHLCRLAFSGKIQPLPVRTIGIIIKCIMKAYHHSRDKLHVSESSTDKGNKKEHLFVSRRSLGLGCGMRTGRLM
jgi:hypothetical protein